MHVYIPPPSEIGEQCMSRNTECAGSIRVPCVHSATSRRGCCICFRDNSPPFHAEPEHDAFNFPFCSNIVSCFRSLLANLGRRGGGEEISLPIFHSRLLQHLSLISEASNACLVHYGIGRPIWWMYLNV